MCSTCFFFFFLHETTVSGRTGLPEYREKAVFVPQMTRGHTILMLNTFGAVSIKSYVYKEKQDGSVFHRLSQDAKVYGCRCNSWPSGLSGNARHLRMEAFGGDLVYWHSRNGRGKG